MLLLYMHLARAVGPMLHFKVVTPLEICKALHVPVHPSYLLVVTNIKSNVKQQNNKSAGLSKFVIQKDSVPSWGHYNLKRMSVNINN
jgi:hypothetical protein